MNFGSEFKGIERVVSFIFFWSQYAGKYISIYVYIILSLFEASKGEQHVRTEIESCGLRFRGKLLGQQGSFVLNRCLHAICINLAGL